MPRQRDLESLKQKLKRNALKNNLTDGLVTALCFYLYSFPLLFKQKNMWDP